jgi:uncharacterized membrane protein YqjE
MATTHPVLENTPTTELIGELINGVSDLVDKQIEMAKQEAREDVHQVAGAAKSLGIGAGVLLVSLMCVLIGLFLAIDTLLPRWGWAVALVVGIALGILGALLAMRGVKAVKVSPLASTRETLKEDVEWAKLQVTPNGRSSRPEPSSPPSSAS